MLTPREIIADAWAISVRERKMKIWGFIYALLETLRELELILYQVYFLYWYFVGESKGYWAVEIDLLRALPLWLFILLTLLSILLIVFELFVPTIATGAIIGLGAKAYGKEKVNGGLILGLYNFFPILEIHGMFILSSFSIVFSACSLILRYGGNDPGIKFLAIGTILLLWAIAGFFRLLSVFAEEAVVIHKMGVFRAMGLSFKLIISNWSHFMFLILLMVVISIRIIMRTVLILLVPGIGIGVGLLLTFVLPATFSYAIGAFIGLILLGLASYFIAYLHIFKQTVWTITFMELSKQKELDVIG